MKRSATRRRRCAQWCETAEVVSGVAKCVARNAVQIKAGENACAVSLLSIVEFLLSSVFFFFFRAAVCLPISLLLLLAFFLSSMSM